MPTSPPSFTPTDRDVDPRALLRKYRRFWPWYALSLTAAALGAGLYLRYTAPEFLSNATLLIKDERAAVGSEEDLFNDLGLLKKSRVLDNEIQVLRSRNVVARVVHDLDLTTRYFTDGRLHRHEVYGTAPLRIVPLPVNKAVSDREFKLSGKREVVIFTEIKSGWRTRQPYGQAFDSPFGRFLVQKTERYARAEGSRLFVQFVPLREATDEILDRLTVKPVVKNSIGTTLDLSLTGPTPGRDTAILNRLIAVYNQAGIDDKNRVAANTIAFIDQRLRTLTGELSGVEKGVEVFKRENGIADLSLETGQMLRQTGETEAILRQQELRRELLRELEIHLRDPVRETALVPTTLDLADPALLTGIEGFNALQLQREKLLRSVPAINPLVSTLDAQRLSLRANLLGTVQNLRLGLDATIRRLRTADTRSTRRLAAVPGKERAFGEISRQQRIKADLYQYLLQKKEEAALAQAVTAPAGRVLDEAQPSRLPVSPKPISVLLVALLVGLALPTIGVALRDVFDDKINSPRDIQRLTPTPVLGRIAHSETGQPLVVQTDSRSAAAEQFRLLRANFQYANATNPGNVVLITSGRSGEGKSFVTLNLGLTLALAGRRTVLLEFDLRKPRLTRYLGLPTTAPGLTNFLVGDADGSDLLRPSGVHPNLFLISSGPVPPNPVELLGLPQLDNLLTQLSTQFDCVLMDTSPAGLVADAATLNRFAARTLLVVRQRFTRKTDLQHLLDRCTDGQLSRPVIVFNDVRDEETGYGYADGYYQRTQKGWGFWRKPARPDS
ncbi:MAG: polysaccharide biosynthesis tyrosine autokinase [Sphingobacteriaceae bacterium]|nr:polysaccharide biosynthesis tyrosine autokinase [Cytophagaceae bacterium]